MPKFEYYFGDRYFKIDGRPIMIDEQLTETEDPHLAQRQALTQAHYEDSGEQVLMKIRYDLHPKSYDDPEIPLYDRDYATDEFLMECDLVEVVHETGHGPRYITHLNIKAGINFPYTKGYVDFLVMSSPPGDNLFDIYKGLFNDQRASIRRQMAKIFDYMYQEGFLLSHQDPNFFRYDRESDMLYLIDLTDFIRVDTEKGSHITEDSIHVRTYNIWLEDKDTKPTCQDSRDHNPGS